MKPPCGLWLVAPRIGDTLSKVVHCEPVDLAGVNAMQVFAPPNALIEPVGGSLLRGERARLC